MFTILCNIFLCEYYTYIQLHNCIYTRIYVYVCIYTILYYILYCPYYIHVLKLLYCPYYTHVLKSLSRGFLIFSRGNGALVKNGLIKQNNYDEFICLFLTCKPLNRNKNSWKKLKQIYSIYFVATFQPKTEKSFMALLTEADTCCV